MIFCKHIPEAPLNKYVECIVYVEGNNKGIGFPKTAMSIVFNLHDAFKLYTDQRFIQSTDHKKYWVAGFQTGPSYVESYGASKMIVIQFTTLGAQAFFQQPLRHFTDQYTSLDCLFKNEADEVWERLQAAETTGAKIRIAETFLRRKLQVNNQAKDKLISSLHHLLQNDRLTSVAAFCKQQAVSRKHLNSLFQEYIGVSPKMMLSLKRFGSVLYLISKSKRGNLTDLAYELDFFDQAHFNNSFKRFTGLKPREYIKNTEQKPALKMMPYFLPMD